MVNANIGHNFNAAIDDLKNKQGRINLNNKIIDEYLERGFDKETDKYLPVQFKDSEIVGLRAVANRDGTKTFRFYHTPKGKGETSVSIGQYCDQTGNPMTPCLHCKLNGAVDSYLESTAMFLT